MNLESSEDLNLMKQTNWHSVALYYLIACLWSWPFFWWRDVNSESWKALDIPNFFKTWSYMWGPGIAAVLCFIIFRTSHRREMTFKGTSLKHGLAFFAVLPMVIALLNRDPKILMFGALGFFSILGEELGWRGFLQDALKIKSDYVKAFLIGLLWEIWHFTNRTVQPGAVIRVLIWISITSVLSFIFIKLTKKTKSLFIPITLHMALNAAFEFNLGWQSVVVCMPIWLLIYRSWIQTERAEC
jgi:uncharacterized protein